MGFSWRNDQAKKGDLPQKVYVKFYDPHVGLVSHVTSEGSDHQSKKLSQ